MRLTITGKVFLAFTVVVFTFGLTSIYAVYQMRRLHGNVRLLQDGHLRVMLSLAEAGGDLKAFDAILEEKDPVLLEKMLTVARNLYPFPEVVRRSVTRARRAVTEQLGRAMPAEERLLFQKLLAEIGELDMGLVELEEGSGELLLVVVQRDFARVADVQERLRGGSRRLQVRVRRLASALSEALDRWVVRADDDERRTVWAVIFLSAISIVVALGVTLATGWAIRPVARLTEAVKEVSAGGEVRRVEVETSDEIGVLAREFNKMVESLEQRDRALRHSERLATVGRMAAQVAHEVRNPLLSIGLNTELLEEEMGELAGTSGEEARSLLQSIQREVERLVGVTEDYLTLARLPQPDLDSTDLDEMLEDLLDFQAEELARKGIEVERRLHGNLPAVRVDANQLRQAVMNLVRNAAEAMSSGGRITVTTTLDEGCAEIAIIDTGRGVAADDLERIFDPLYSTKPDGTGLGLAVTRQIVQVHGGSIRCHTEVGVGTTFCVRLPLAPGAVPEVGG